jgi:hypothetical protein
MREFALIVEYGTGKAAMLTQSCDIRIALGEFYKELEKMLPKHAYKDFTLPTVISCELLSVDYNTYKEGKQFALVFKHKNGSSVMLTDVCDISKALDKLTIERAERNPVDRFKNLAYDIQACEIVPVLYHSVYGD